MRRFTKLFLLVSVALCCLINLPSCGSKGPITQIFVPDSTLVGEVSPEIDGTVSEFYSFVPGNYFIDATDSILVMDVVLRLNKNFTPDPDNFLFPRIATGEGALSQTPYIVLLDKKGNIIPDFYMEMDGGLLQQMEAMIIGDPGEEIGLHFVAPAGLDESKKADLANDAYNFRLVGNVTFEKDEFAELPDSIDTQYM